MPPLPPDELSASASDAPPTFHPRVSFAFDIPVLIFNNSVCQLIVSALPALVFKGRPLLCIAPVLGKGRTLGQERKNLARSSQGIDRPMVASTAGSDQQHASPTPTFPSRTPNFFSYFPSMTQPFPVASESPAALYSRQTLRFPGVCTVQTQPCDDASMKGFVPEALCRPRTSGGALRVPCRRGTPSFTDFWQSASNSTLLPGGGYPCQISGIGQPGEVRSGHHPPLQWNWTIA